MYSVLGLLFVALVIRFRPQNARWVQGGLRQAVIALAASLGVLSVHAVAASDDRAAGRIDKTLWPAAQIATRFDQIWRAQTGQSLHIVAGDSWTAGMAGLLSSGHPSLFTDLDPGRSPAITERRLEREGMLVIWVGDASWHPDPTLVADFPHGRESFLAGRATVALNYLLIAPGQWSDGDWERWVEPPQ
jgi:hypothetical protein